MRNSILHLAFLLFLSFSNCAIAAIAPKYAVVDIEKILAQSESFKNFKNSWDQENSKYQKETAFYEQEIARAHKLLSGNQKELSDAEASNLKYRLGQYEIKMQQLVQTRKIKMDEQFGITSAKLRNKVNRLIQKYASENNISMVMPKAHTVYIAPSLDITDSIIADLDRDEKR